MLSRVVGSSEEWPGRHPARREQCSLCGADFWNPKEELPSKPKSLPHLPGGRPSLFERGDPTRPCLSSWGSSCHLPIIFLLLSFCVCLLLFLSLSFFLLYLFILLLLLLLLLLSHFSRVRFCATPETAAHQAPPSLGFSRQEHWSGLPFPSPMHESEK